jgi:Arc/MetJ-type ribon-helix-helix transcriptional regulator
MRRFKGKMKNETINLPIQVLVFLEKLVAEGFYSNRSEAIRQITLDFVQRETILDQKLQLPLELQQNAHRVLTVYFPMELANAIKHNAKNGRFFGFSDLVRMGLYEYLLRYYETHTESLTQTFSPSDLKDIIFPSDRKSKNEQQPNPPPTKSPQSLTSTPSLYHPPPIIQRGDSVIIDGKPFHFVEREGRGTN